jgi:diguanylate cyclase (GGDEF)-like protein
VSGIFRKRVLGFWIVILPLMIAITGMLLGNAQMLDGISHSVDKVDEYRTWQAVQSAFKNEIKRVSGILSDNAKWDDAVDHSYGEIDEAWIFDTWGFATNDTNYDTALVVAPSGKILVGYHKGKKLSGDTSDYFGPSAKNLLRALPHDKKTFVISNSLVKSSFGIAALAAAPILPHTASKTISVERPNILVFSKVIDQESLKLLDEQYVFDGLALYDVDTNRTPRFVLRDSWGDAVAEATWTPASLGSIARNSYVWSSVRAVAALIAAMTPAVIGLGYALFKLDQKEQIAKRTAREDSLSGLPNRLYFQEYLEERLNHRDDEVCAMMLVDLDGFKHVNDAFDHATGDKLIRAVAAGLQSLVGSRYKLARLGGDEFAIVIMGESAVQAARDMSKSILKFLHEPFDLEGRIAAVSASIGIAELSPDILESQELLRRADIAMYSVKAQGGAGYRVFEKSLDQNGHEDIRIADELRRLLAANHFDVHYQPLVDAKTRKIIGVEALARWPETAAHRCGPDRFIHVAEQFGIIDSLSQLITKTAFRDSAAWPDLRLSINISPLQLNNRNLVGDIKAAAAESAFDLTRLEVEFTEAVLIKNAKQARKVMHELKQLGVRVGLDDFGVGYASVGYLHDFNFDTIKLDRSLTKQTSTSAATLQVVQGTILIARGLTATVVAEGIETEEDAQIMHLAGCQVMQGYYFFKPQPASHITAQIRERPIETVLLTA